MIKVNDNTTTIIEKGSGIRTIQLIIDMNNTKETLICGVIYTGERIGLVVTDRKERQFCKVLNISSQEYIDLDLVKVTFYDDNDEYSVSVSVEGKNLLLSCTHIENDAL